MIMGKTKLMVTGEVCEVLLSHVDACDICDKGKLTHCLLLRCCMLVHKRCTGVKDSVPAFSITAVS